MQPSRKDFETFEETYPLYPFAELVRLAVLLGRRLARVRPRRSDDRGSPAGLQRQGWQRLSPR